MTAFPTLFVSHGAPTLALDGSPAHRFLREYGERLGRPEAVLAVTAHWETPAPVLGAAHRPETVHDFFGFPEALYRLRYEAPGAPTLAENAARRLAEAGFEAALDARRGLDHGTWVPLLLLYPEADVPVAQISVQPFAGPAHHLALGRALAPLREEGVLILGSGAATHNLAAFGGKRADAPPAPWAAEFAEWLAETIAEGQIEALLDYRTRAPHAARNHPTEEHILPLYVALGAAGGNGCGRRIHASFAHGVLAMDVYAFEC